MKSNGCQCITNGHKCIPMCRKQNCAVQIAIDVEFNAPTPIAMVELLYDYVAKYSLPKCYSSCDIIASTDLFHQSDPHVFVFGHILIYT